MKENDIYNNTKNNKIKTNKCFQGDNRHLHWKL